MYKLQSIALLAAIALLTACNSQSSQANNTEDQTMPMHDMAATTDIKMVAHRFNDVNPKQSPAIKSITQDYLQIKDALVNGNSSDAAKAAGKMSATLKSVDKSLFTAAQNEAYESVATGLKTQATQIADNAADLDQQRNAFASMSQHMYELVKAFGAGTTIYHAHCPMYHDGAMWLSDSKEVRNPFYGDEMMNCGSVQEQIQ